VGSLRRLWLRLGLAAVLAAVLLWAERGQGSLAASARALASRYIHQTTVLPFAAGARGGAPPSGRHGGGEPPELGWPLHGAVEADKAGGIDILAPGGALVRACAAGRVTAVGSGDPGASVTISGGGLTLRYLHLGPADVKVGDKVVLGQVIGAVTHFAPGEPAHLQLLLLHGAGVKLPGSLGPP